MVIEMLNERMKAKKMDSTAEFPFICIMIDDLKRFVETVSDEACDKVERITRLAKGLNVAIIVSGRSVDMDKYSNIETLTRSIINCQNGLALSGTPNDYSYFKNNLKYSEKGVELVKGNAYLFVSGSCKTIKVIG